MSNKDLSTVDEKSKAVATYDYGEDAGVGFENASPGDFKPSFLRVLQSNSPQCVDQLPGCAPGKIWDNISGETFTSVLFIPAVREHVYVAWRPRQEGGGGGQGFGGVYQLGDKVVVDALRAFESEHESKFERGDDGKIIHPKTADGEFDLVESVYFHGVQAVEESGAVFPVTIPLSSTGMPLAGSWFTSARRQIIPGTGKPYPLFAHIYKLGSSKVEKKGNKWFVLTQTWGKGSADESRLDPKGDLYQSARAVAVAFKEGKAKVDYAQGGGADADTKKDVNVPF